MYNNRAPKYDLPSWLQILELTTFETRMLTADLIQVYKILTKIDHVIRINFLSSLQIGEAINLSCISVA